MSIRGRMAAGFAGIVACFGVTFGVVVWANAVRGNRVADLERAAARQIVITAVKRSLLDLQKELALLVGVYDAGSAGGTDAEAQARFDAQLAAISAQFDRLAESERRESVVQRKFRRTFDQLARSWSSAYHSLGRDVPAAITELSVRGDPLAATLLRDLLPQWEEEAREEVADASEKLRSATRVTNASTAVIFAISAILALILAYRISRTLLGINDELEARVAERTSALVESEERYAIAARGANDGLWDWDLRRHRIYFSPRWKAMLGHADEEISDSSDEWMTRIHPDDRKGVEASIRAHLDRSTPHFESEHRMLHRDASYRWMLCRGLALFDDDGKPLRMAGSQTDITARRDADERLLHDALHDGLTGLANRTLLLDRLEWCAARNKRHPEMGYAVLFLDLDRFKVVNDSLGHEIGDQLLIGIARRLEACVRPGDTLARLGGDEFATLLEEIALPADAEAVALRIHVALSVPFHIGGHDVYASMSIGIAVSNRGYIRAEDLLRDADTAMYSAKSRGRARHEVFDAAMHVRARERLEIETALRRAVEAREFVLEYQPIFSLPDERVVSMEALVRWKRGDVLLPPTEFIFVAEETGLIVPLGQWVLRTACVDLLEWRSFGIDIGVAVNVSPRQLSERGFVDSVVDMLRELGLVANALTLEITEGMLIENPQSALLLLRQLHDADVRLCLDDFGTGYSSLNSLHTYPIDAIKIDRSFTARMGAAGDAPHFAEAILALARTLGVSVTAEGVETRDQIDQLRAMQCPYAQGFLLSRPLGKDAATQFLQSKLNRSAAVPPPRSRTLLPPPVA